MNKIPKIVAVGATRGAIISRMWQRDHMFRLVGICDLDTGLANEQAELAKQDGFARPRIFSDISEMLQQGGFDIVMLATPDAFHFDHASRIFSAGFHCYIEKPMTTSVADASKLVKIWKKSGKIAVIGHEWRYVEAIEFAREKIRQGVIGDSRLAVTLDYCGRMGCYWRRKEWRRHLRHPGNSLTLQKAIHHLDIQAYLLDCRAESVFASGGMNHFGGDKPESLTCDQCEEAASCIYHVDKIKVNGHPAPLMARDRLCVFGENVHLRDNQVVAIDYENGARGSYVECFFSPEYRVEHTIIGGLGQIRIIAYSEKPLMTVELNLIGEHEPEIFQISSDAGHGGGDIAIGRALNQAVRNQQQIQPDPIDGYYTVATACAIDESVATRKPVMLEKLLSTIKIKNAI